MKSAIEDKIIAYFDGDLSDADSAELLHLTSVSLEIRDLFRQHEMLRELAHEATRTAMVSPEVEASLLSRIEVLAEAPVKEKAVLVFSRRGAVLAALALVLISSSLGYLVPKLLSNGSENTAFIIAPKSENISQLHTPAVNAFIASREETSLIAKSNDRSNYAEENHVSFSKPVSDRENEEQVVTASLTDKAVKTDEVGSFSSHGSAMMTAISSVSTRTEDIHSSNIGERHSPFDPRGISSDIRSLFEIGLQTSSGFTYPADATPIKPFADQRLSVAYHITENNLIGFRLGSGLYQVLGDVKRRQENGVEVLSRNIETKRSFSEELYLTHLEPVFFVAPFTLEFSLGGGFIPNGYIIGTEAGVRIPLSESFQFGVAFALSRIHSNALASGAILASESNSSMPVLLTESSDVHNTLNGRLHYGIIYQF